MNRLITLALSCILILGLTGIILAETELTATEIIKQVEESSYIESSLIRSEMIIHAGPRKITKEMLVKTLGTDKAVIEFTNLRDRGTKFLKIEESLYMLFPDSEDIVQISGHMLNQGMMGSDFSYKDSLDNSKMTTLYDFTLVGEEELDGVLCYVIEAIAKPDEEVSYYQRKQWIDKDKFVLMKEELYARSGKLMKVSQSKEVQLIDGRYVVTHSIMEDKLKKKTQTEYIVKEIEFNPDFDDETFTLKSLR